MSQSEIWVKFPPMWGWQFSAALHGCDVRGPDTPTPEDPELEGFVLYHGPNGQFRLEHPISESCVVEGPRIVAFVQALPDPEAVAWLLSALDHLEQFRNPRAR